nr:unnamed protein product [Callosobruchus chinensis]
MCDIQDFHTKFYSRKDKIIQDFFILKHINAEKPKRERVTKSTSSRKGVAVKYFVKVQGTKKFCVQVCQRAFLHILGVSKDRVQRISRNYVYAGTLPKENRGGSTVSAIYAKRSACVREFIEKLSCTEVHYCRGKTSAVFHTLSSCDLSAYSKIRLCADGCGGQNRNSTMIAMCMYFLKNIAPHNLKCIEIVFPIRGHSFLPSDRVFGTIERKLKKMPEITNPQTYIDLFKEHGAVYQLKACSVKDWKSVAQDYLKGVQSWHFKFSKIKRFFIEKQVNETTLTVRGEENYTVDLGENRSVLKRGKKIGNAHIADIAEGVIINPKKLKDIKTLLTAHFGETWIEDNQLNFFKEFLENANFENRDVDTMTESNIGNEAANDFCEVHPEEEDGLRI